VSVTAVLPDVGVRRDIIVSSGVVWQTVRVDPQFDRWRKTGCLDLLPVLILGVSYPSLSFKNFYTSSTEVL
jgi:hypothetical protein